MTKWFANKWRYLSNNGVRPEHSYEETKRIRILNQSAMIGLINTFVYGVILIILTFPKLIKLDIDVHFIFDISFLFALICCSWGTFCLVKRIGYNTGAIFTLIAVPTLLFTLSIVVKSVGIEYYFFPFFILLFYLIKKRKTVFIISVYYTILFCLASYFDYVLNYSLISSSNTQIFYFVDVIISFLSSFAFLNLFLSEFEKKQKEIEIKNTQLEEAVISANQKSDKIKLLLQELSHRTKNNLQLISSIISLQSDKITDDLAKSSIEETKNRIYSLSLLHQKLYLKDNLNTFSLSEYTEDLFDHLINIFDEKSNLLRITKDIDIIEMKIDQAVHIGLIINEILTNSFKHGLANHKDKFINISVKKTNDHDIRIAISDCGEGISNLADYQKSKSFGGSLIFSLVKQLNGNISFNEHENNEIVLSLKNIL
jgi:two-component sensor histidine kinase